MTDNLVFLKDTFCFARIKAFIKKESVLSIAVTLAVVSSFISVPKI